MKVGHWVGESAEGGGQVEVAGSGHVSDHERSAQAGDLTCGLRRDRESNSLESSSYM